MVPSQLSRQFDIVDYPRQTRRARRHDHLVQVRILSDDREGCRFDQIRELRLRKPTLQRPQHRRRKHDIADEAQPDQEDFHCEPFRALS